MSRAAENLLALTKAKGQTLVGMCRLLHRNGTYLQQFVTRGVPEELKMVDRIKLCAVLDCKMEDLTNDLDELNTFRHAMKKAPFESFNLTANTGWVRERGKINAKTKRIDFTGPDGGAQGMATPAILVGVKDAYSTVMPDECMQPAIPVGAVVFVNPVRAPLPGEDVVIKFKDGSGTIRNFLGRFEQAGFIMVQQYNPPSEFSVPLAEIESIHLIAATTRAKVG